MFCSVIIIGPDYMFAVQPLSSCEIGVKQSLCCSDRGLGTGETAQWALPLLGANSVFWFLRRSWPWEETQEETIEI